MVDHPQCRGKMRDWDKVDAVPGAREVLHTLSGRYDIYVATNAQTSSVQDIQYAFHRVGLDACITGYFCKDNLGIGKGTPAFFIRIANALNTPVSNLVMIGDSLERDIRPAKAAGLMTVWFNAKGIEPDKTIITPSIRRLEQLHTLLADEAME